MISYTCTVTIVSEQPFENLEHVQNEIKYALNYHNQVEGLSHEEDSGLVDHIEVSELQD